MKILSVVGARPNFMKISPLMREMKKCSEIQPILVHTGQHYDDQMSTFFFNDLGLPEPDICLGVGSGTHAEQTGRIMIEFERVCFQEEPDLVIVVGDVNSTVACALVAAKLCLPIAHVEAGLRSFDRSMPEEINRILTDQISDYLFTTSEDAGLNLLREGIPESNIFFVGNVMIDTLLRFRAQARIKAKLRIENKDYGLLTLHRPSNVDDSDVFWNILEALQIISKETPIIFPAHPRTLKQIKTFGYERYFNFLDLSSTHSANLKNSINLLGPLPYLEFLNKMINAKFILTDSGGVQEEATILGIPCLTLRDSTERPITVKEGTNIIVGNDGARIIKEIFSVLNGKRKVGGIPRFWDGKAAERIVKILLTKLVDERIGEKQLVASR